MEIYIPFDIWCEISRHIPSADLDMLWRFRLISRDSNRAVELLLNQITLCNLDNVFNFIIKPNAIITATRYPHGIWTTLRKDDIFFQHVLANYYYGCLHGNSFTMIYGSAPYPLISGKIVNFHKGKVVNFYRIVTYEKILYITEMQGPMLNLGICRFTCNTHNKFAISHPYKKRKEKYEFASEEDSDLYYFIIHVPNTGDRNIYSDLLDYYNTIN